MEVAAVGRCLFVWFTFSPIPKITEETLLPTLFDSTRMPPSLPDSRTRSFGHFNQARTPVSSTTARLVAFDARNCRRETLPAGNFGLRITENHSPPLWDSHLLPFRPLPRV